MKSIETLVKTQDAEWFIHRLQEHRQDILETAKEFVAAVCARPEIIEELLEKGVSRQTIGLLDRLGTGRMLPQLALSNDPVMAKLSNCDLNVQKDCLANGIEVLDPNETDLRKIPIADLTHDQTRQVFSYTHVRSLAEQRTWLRARKAKMNPPSKLDVLYRVRGSTVETFQPGRWSKQVLLQWLSEMN